MFEIDKDKFGAFLSQLRKEKGLMQKELAEKLYVSDKAVSKWERGLSIPDVALLVPLSEILGVTVTELLECRRLPQNISLDTQQTEQVVKKVIGMTEEKNIVPTGANEAFRCCAVSLQVAWKSSALFWSVGRPFFFPRFW